MNHQATLVGRLDAALDALPLVAILRGLRPAEAVEIGQTLYGAGFRLIEVPLNSPEPLGSITLLREALPGDAVGQTAVARRASQRARPCAGGAQTSMP